MPTNHLHRGRFRARGFDVQIPPCTGECTEGLIKSGNSIRPGDEFSQLAKGHVFYAPRDATRTGEIRIVEQDRNTISSGLNIALQMGRAFMQCRAESWQGVFPAPSCQSSVGKNPRNRCVRPGFRHSYLLSVSYA